MKILYVHDRFGAFGGAESNILATATEFRAKGHAVAILHGPETDKNNSAWMSAFQTRFPLTLDSAHGQISALQIFAPDVIYVHKLADLDVLAQLLDTGVPVVRMIHDHDLCCMKGYKYNTFTRRICERAASPFCIFPCGAFLARNHDGGFPFKWSSYAAKLAELELNRRCERLIVATDFMKQELCQNKFDPEKIEIHAPVPPERDPSFYSSFNDRNIIVYAGQIIRGKGVDVLLEALERVRAPFECFILGDGNHRAYCEKLSRKLCLEHRVHFKGFVPAEEMKIFYRECSAVVMSSVWPEPFGGVGLEAMHFGLPVVAFDAGGIREWLMDGHNGRLVPWMDRAAFAAAVEELLGDKALARRMGENGRRMISQHFDFSKYIEGLEGLFARVAEKNIATHPV